MGAIHLIRHGQASWDAEDYDELSERGIRQSALLGMAWEASDWGPTTAISGSLRRHTQTAVAAIDASGRGDGYDVDAGWDEYDHRSLTDRLSLTRTSMTPQEFQPVLEESLAKWMDGALTEAGNSYDDWHGGILGSLERALEAAGSGQDVAVFTSGGPIATVVSHPADRRRLPVHPAQRGDRQRQRHYCHQRQHRAAGALLQRAHAPAPRPGDVQVSRRAT